MDIYNMSNAGLCELYDKLKDRANKLNIKLDIVVDDKKNKVFMITFYPEQTVKLEDLYELQLWLDGFYAGKKETYERSIGH